MGRVALALLALVALVALALPDLTRLAGISALLAPSGSQEASEDCRSTDPVTEAIREHWQGEDAVLAWAVSRHESGHDPLAYNPAAGGNRGVFQINSVHTGKLASGDWTDVGDNVRMAKAVYDEARDEGRDPWEPWESYTTGRHVQYLDDAREALAEVMCTQAVGDYPEGKPGAWGGHGNGRIPAPMLCPVDLPGVVRGGMGLLRCDAAAALTELGAEFRLRTGSELCFGNGYRSYDEQVVLKRQKPGLAARPGTSNHGWGLAVDFCEDAAGYAILAQIAGSYGWFHPRWAQPGGSKPERWHWEYGEPY